MQYESTDKIKHSGDGSINKKEGRACRIYWNDHKQASHMGVGILYLWVFPAEKYTAWPHFMMLSFYLFVVISAGMILVSLLDKRRQECTLNMKKVMEKPAKSVILAWTLLTIIMIGLYLFFNGH